MYEVYDPFIQEFHILMSLSTTSTNIENEISIH
jgi:hypothetical protein